MPHKIDTKNETSKKIRHLFAFYEKKQKLDERSKRHKKDTGGEKCQK